VQVQRTLYGVSTSQAFKRFFIALILVSTGVMAYQHDGIDPATSAALSVASQAIGCAFAIELVINVAALGLRNFLSDSFNVFDLTIVSLSLLEFLSYTSGGGGGFASLRVLRPMRVLRILKIFAYLDSLRKIGEVLVRSVASFMAIGVLTVLFMTVFAIVGLHVFGGSIPDSDFPNFNSFLDSFLAIFLVRHGTSSVMSSSL
jgi:hypothetical protein